MRRTLSLRDLRLAKEPPLMCDEVAAAIRRRWRVRCTASYLAAVERGTKRPGPKLVAAMALYYGRSRSTIWRYWQDAAKTASQNGGP